MTTTSGYYSATPQQATGMPGYIPGMVPNPAYGAAPQTNPYGVPTMNYAWNQTAQAFGYPTTGYAGYNPTVFNINGAQMPSGVNYLTEDESKMINVEKKKPFEIDPVEKPISKCTHKYLPGHPQAGQIAGVPDENDILHCNVCTKDVRLLDLTQEMVDEATQYMIDIMDNIKIKWINVPQQIVEGIYTIEPILRKMPVAFKCAQESWNQATAQGKIFQTNNINTNTGFGPNAYTPVPTQYNVYNPYMGGIVQPQVSPYMAPQPQVNPYSNPYAQPQVATPAYGSPLTNNPLVQPQPQAPVVPQAQPTVPVPGNPYGMPNIGTTTQPQATATTAATQQPPVGSGYTPASATGTPDPTTMTTTTTAQTV